LTNTWPSYQPVSSYSRLAVSRRSPTYFQARKMRSAATATTTSEPVEADRKNSRGCSRGSKVCAAMGPPSSRKTPPYSRPRRCA
jgi:hypothetical protein